MAVVLSDTKLEAKRAQSAGGAFKGHFETFVMRKISYLCEDLHQRKFPAIAIQ